MLTNDAFFKKKKKFLKKLKVIDIHIEDTHVKIINNGIVLAQLLHFINTKKKF